MLHQSRCESPIADTKIIPRLEKNGTAHGRVDWVLNASSLVLELHHALKHRSIGLQEIHVSIEEAARILDDQTWSTFCCMTSRGPKDDSIMFAAHVAPILLLLGRGARHECVYAGITPPSAELQHCFEGAGWNLIAQGSARGTYPLVLASLVFQHTVECAREGNLVHGTKTACTAAGADKQCVTAYGFESVSSLRRITWAESEFSSPLLSGSNCGPTGVTFEQGVQTRLQMIRHTLIFAMQSIAMGGSLVITWSGVPDHPMLLFITSHLRRRFSKVRVVTSPDTSSFEVYAIAVGFIELGEQVENWNGWGKTFEYFLRHKVHRIDGYDDVLLWTLSNIDLLSEALHGGKSSTGAQNVQFGTYDALWITFAHKYKMLALEVCEQVPSQWQHHVGGKVGRQVRPQSALGLRNPECKTGDSRASTKQLRQRPQSAPSSKQSRFLRRTSQVTKQSCALDNHQSSEQHPNSVGEWESDACSSSAYAKPARSEQGPMHRSNQTSLANSMHVALRRVKGVHPSAASRPVTCGALHRPQTACLGKSVPCSMRSLYSTFNPHPPDIVP